MNKAGKLIFVVVLVLSLMFGMVATSSAEAAEETGAEENTDARKEASKGNTAAGKEDKSEGKTDAGGKDVGADSEEDAPDAGSEDAADTEKEASEGKTDTSEDAAGAAQEEGEDSVYTINGISFTADPEVWQIILDEDDFKSFIMREENGHKDVYLITGELYEDFSEDPDELFSAIAGDGNEITANLFAYDPEVSRTDYYQLNGLQCMSFFFNGEDGEYMELQAIRNTEDEILLMALIVLNDIDARTYLAPWRQAALSVCPEGGTETSEPGINTEGLDAEGNFRGFYWGDDIAFVAEEEDAEAKGAELRKQAITGLPVTVAGYDAEASFSFDDGMLVSGKYMLLSEYEYGDEYVEEYETLKAALIQVYGEPDKDFIKTVVQEKSGSYGESLGEELEAGQVELYAVWHAADTEIQLTTGYRDDILAARIYYHMEVEE